jgi:hypothetical protein
MNPLDQYPEARKIAYYVQFVVAGILLLLGLGFAAAQMDLPTWYNVATAVTTGLWTYLGLTAAKNTDTPSAYAADEFEDEGVE